MHKRRVLKCLTLYWNNRAGTVLVYILSKYYNVYGKCVSSRAPVSNMISIDLISECRWHDPKDLHTMRPEYPHQEIGDDAKFTISNLRERSGNGTRRVREVNTTLIWEFIISLFTG